MTINSFTGKYAFLSNFHKARIMWAGLPCLTVEHGFQAAKATNLEDSARIARQATAGDAKAMGRHITLRKDWEQVKDGIMLDLLRIKFASHHHLAAQLKATGFEILEEGNTWGDRYWGTVKGEGENMLGNLLMLVRWERRLGARRIGPDPNPELGRQIDEILDRPES